MRTREQVISKMKSLSKDFDRDQKEAHDQYIKQGLDSFEYRGILLMKLRALAWGIGLKNHDKFITTK